MRVSHAPDDYVCNFCRIANGGVGVRTTQHHVVLRSEGVTAFVASHWWPENPGHVLVVTNEHVENLYEFPAPLGAALMDATRRVAIAMKVAYGCSGVSTRQHNEPDGNQDVWHFHQHVFPRYRDDHLYERHAEKALADETRRLDCAAVLREALGQLG
jgi:histidine triad (HIT) family protein